MSLFVAALALLVALFACALIAPPVDRSGRSRVISASP
jgi:hypothetical protein